MKSKQYMNFRKTGSFERRTWGKEIDRLPTNKEFNVELFTSNRRSDTYYELLLNRTCCGEIVFEENSVALKKRQFLIN